MEKSKFLTYTVIALLLLNLATLAFLFASGAKNHQPGEGLRKKPMPREIIIERLHFDAQQVREYDKLIAMHRSSIGRTEDKIRQCKNELYQLLNENPVDEKTKTALIAAISENQKEIETIHFNHFQAISKLCRAEQRADFKQLTTELSQLFQHPRKPRHD